MHERCRIYLADNRCRFCDRLQRPCLVIGLHNRNKHGLAIHGFPQAVQQKDAVLIHRKVYDLKSLLFEISHRIADRRMLHLGRDKPVPAAPVCHRSPNQRQVIGLCSPGCKDNFLFRNPQRPGNFCCRFPDMCFGFHAFFMQGRRISVITVHHPQHSLLHAPGTAGCCRIV